MKSLNGKLFKTKKPSRKTRRGPFNNIISNYEIIIRSGLKINLTFIWINISRKGR